MNRLHSRNRRSQRLPFGCNRLRSFIGAPLRTGSNASRPHWRRIASGFGVAMLCLVVVGSARGELASTIDDGFVPASVREGGFSSGVGKTDCGRAERGIQLLEPANGGVYEDAIPVEVVFGARGRGCGFDMSSLRVVYKKAWGIDITRRIRPYVDAHAIRIPSLELPAGDHSVKISILDHDRVRHEAVFSVTIRD